MGAHQAFDPARKTRLRQAGRRDTEVVNGVMYVLSGGCQWRALSADLPPPAPCMAIFNLYYIKITFSLSDAAISHLMLGRNGHHDIGPAEGQRL